MNHLPAAPPAKTLVIACGNALRCDDSVGARAAAAIAAWRRPEIDVRSVHQLTPELAKALAAVERAIFVDARVACLGETVQVQLLEPADSLPWMGHLWNPYHLLALAEVLYGRAPRAWLVTLPATDFSAGDQLSPLAERGLDEAIERIDALIASSDG
jgi:hydrogenase maturation protease